MISPTATKGDLAASSAASGNVDNDVHNVPSDGGIDSTNGHDWGIKRHHAPLQATLTPTSLTAEVTVASTGPTATTGDLAASPAALGDVDDDVDDG